ncbi:right-handed parallel beta-helix repeat-containing protein [Hymenobacter sp. 15J16-1T3B]|uniref:T9SS type A sorting domain-containing protein n=1 Tax=Hymenobacter sp. 15J16-1T3B TaxID=2886941 RepID=UPI001D109A12|nr:right-handed parallel beta-helix repeat-containing protein [Hymenobacter sp. 15J16-1T3B]MCC3158820.1 right-handed parallel beta-helix repeat-containing protein [Hymenobacter sp. 15J16-1T3B]
MKPTLLALGTALLAGLTSTSAVAQTSIYVNDAATAGDIYTSAPGSDATGTGSAAAPFASVSRAVAAAAPGATIFVDAGRYQQAILLDKPVSLQGAGDSLSSPASATIFSDGPRTADNVYTGVPALTVAASGSAAQPMRISRMSLRRYDYGIYGNLTGSSISYVVFEDLDVFKCYRQGIELGGNVSDLTFRRVSIRFTRIQSATAGGGAPSVSGNNYGRGLFFNGADAGADKRNLLIEDSAFEQNRRAGIDVNERATSNLVVRRNRFYGNLGPALALLKVAGQRDAGGTYTSIGALIEDNVIQDNADNGFELKSCTGNGLESGPGSFVVRRNRIARGLAQPTNLVADNAAIAVVDRDRLVAGRPSFNDDLTTSGLWIEGNVIRGYRSTAFALFNRNGFGIVLEGSNHQVRHNVVTRCQLGIQVQDRPATTEEQSTAYFDIPRNQLLVSSGVMVQENLVDTCDVASIRAVNLTNPANVALNWLGSNVISDIRGASGTGGLVRTLTPGFGFPEVSSSAPTGRLQFSPFLNSPTDVSVEFGFQPDLSYLRVAANVPDALPAGNMQEAAVAILDGGTIEAEGGTYNESVTVTKNVTLLQTNPSIILRDLTLNGSGKALTLGAPLTLSGSLTLTVGFVNSSATNLLTLADGSSSTEGNASSYVQGPVSKVGGTAFVFPLGRNGVWARLGISAPTASSTFTAEYFAQAYATQTAEPGLATISRVEYWNLERPAGSGAVAVRLFWEDGGRSGITSLPELRVARFDGSQWLSEGNGGTSGSAGAGSVASAAAVGGFGPFTFGSTSPINPLPVELTAFRAEAAGEGRARLYWTTAQEKDNRGFDVERALNGREWQRVGFVAGHGTSTSTQQYSFLDASGLSEVVYYRLRQIDFDGQAKYSSVVAVQLTGKAGQLALYPNPARNELTIQLPAAGATQATVQVLDAVGRTVWTTTAPVTGQRLELQLAGHVKPGLYVVRVSGKGLPTSARQLQVE